MRSLKLALLATAATAVLSSAAMAADLIVDTPVAPVVDNSFTWDGAYAGVFAVGHSWPTAFGLGADFGVNTLMDDVLLGTDFEVTAAWGSGTSSYSGQVTGKVGGVLSDSVLGYAFAGVGDRTATSWYVPVGAGVEFAVADNVSLKTEAQYNFDLTDWDQNSVALKAGINFHF